MSELRESVSRIVRRWPWYRRLGFMAWGVRYSVVDWVKDRWYGAPWEAHVDD